VTVRKQPVLQGTLDLLILRTLVFGPVHGHGIAKHIQRISEDVLQVEHGSLYPALQRLERKGLITAKWEADGRGRELKRYRLTSAGKKQLSIEESRWATLVRAVGRLLKPV
jgi:PadR family transcriptional regulator PadR